MQHFPLDGWDIHTYSMRGAHQHHMGPRVLRAHARFPPDQDLS
jgi:hypothetical protein